MANSAKQKGDRAEREAVEVLKLMAPNLCVEGAIRMLGAGRKDDVGDLRVFDDVAVQVRNYRVEALGLALRSSAVDATAQALNGRVRFALGMVPVPRARKGTVRWLASCERWPMPLWEGGGLVEPCEFTQVSKAVAWLRDDIGSVESPALNREVRVARLSGRGTPVLVGPVEAWLSAYALAVGRPLVADVDVFAADVDVVDGLPHEVEHEAELHWGVV